jgi:PTS system cellobiose-specific IIA component
MTDENCDSGQHYGNVTDEQQAAVAFKIIAATGTARSFYISAIDKAAEKKFDEARDLIKQGQAAFNEGHTAHMELLPKFADGLFPGTSIIMVHAEDQLMSAEAFGILAEKFLALYESLAASDR